MIWEAPISPCSALSSGGVAPALKHLPGQVPSPAGDGGALSTAPAPCASVLPSGGGEGFLQPRFVLSKGLLVSGSFSSRFLSFLLCCLNLNPFKLPRPGCCLPPRSCVPNVRAAMGDRSPSILWRGDRALGGCLHTHSGMVGGQPRYPLCLPCCPGEGPSWVS